MDGGGAVGRECVIGKRVTAGLVAGKEARRAEESAEKNRGGPWICLYFHCDASLAAGPITLDADDGVFDLPLPTAARQFIIASITACKARQR